MLYLNFVNSLTALAAFYLTLTSVVFELTRRGKSTDSRVNLTLTSVVFELSVLQFHTVIVYNLTLTSVVFE